MANKYIPDNEEARKQEAIKIISKMFKKLGISGIVFHPAIGALTIIDNDMHKEMILKHARTEMEYESMVEKNIANNWFMGNNGHKKPAKLPTPNYTG